MNYTNCNLKAVSDQRSQMGHLLVNLKYEYYAHRVFAGLSLKRDIIQSTIVAQAPSMYCKKKLIKLHDELLLTAKKYMYIYINLKRVLRDQLGFERKPESRPILLHRNNATSEYYKKIDLICFSFLLISEIVFARTKNLYFFLITKSLVGSRHGHFLTAPFVCKLQAASKRKGFFNNLLSHLMVDEKKNKLLRSNNNCNNNNKNNAFHLFHIIRPWIRITLSGVSKNSTVSLIITQDDATLCIPFGHLIMLGTPIEKKTITNYQAINDGKHNE
ncbi:hypothetical protein AGLY_001228 [Aphis glycines]|uniref:Uncharacterized protein n=1 Tax=Aphis glycines TaxID=307491 RepID=A0A6G0U976_APHGL|nr:hypothetical protein AGLY_001228 [Aphis glycines]